MCVLLSKAAANFHRRATRWWVRESYETSPPEAVVSRVLSLFQSDRSSCAGSFRRMRFTPLLLKGPQFAGATHRNSDWPLPRYSRQRSCSLRSCAPILYSAGLLLWVWNDQWRYACGQRQKRGQRDLHVPQPKIAMSLSPQSSHTFANRMV